MTTSPTGLRQLQRTLAAVIARPDRSRLDPSVFAVPAGADLLERLDVYAHGYPARIHAALLETYPAVAHVLGHAAFHRLVAGYIAAGRVRTSNLNDAGNALAEFLVGEELTRGLPFLPDLARLEWAVTRCFHAPTLPVGDSGRLTDWSEGEWAEARPQLQPWAEVISSPWPILRIWQAREMPIEEIDIDLTSGGDCVLLRRDGFEVCCEPIDPAGASIFAALRQGASLAQAVELLGGLSASDFETTLARLSANGTIRGWVAG